MQSPRQLSSQLSFFWSKKDKISYILSILILFIHISTFSHYPNDGSYISEVNETVRIIVKYCFTQFAVPLFFVIAGVLFFRDYNKTKYYEKIKRRIFTILIPYLLWNAIWMLFSIAISYSFISNYFIGRQKFIITPSNIFLSLFLYKCNGPFWFIFDLLIFSLAAPFINLIIKNKYVGFLVVVFIPVLASYGICLPEKFFFDSQAIMYYLTGCIIGKHYFPIFIKPACSKHQWQSMLFLLLIAVLIFLEYKTSLILIPKAFNSIVRLISALSFWYASDLFVNKLRPHSIYKTSFAMYAMHSNVMSIITKILFLSLPKDPSFAIPNAILTIVLTPFSIYLFCLILQRYVPRVYTVLMGSR